MNAELTNCLIVGVGGQGTILASRLMGGAAMSVGLDVRGSETIGMAQRGGSVASHVRMGRDIHSPMISPGEADVILAFEPCEGLRAMAWLKIGGMIIVCDRAVQPFSSGGAVGYDAAEVMARIVSAADRVRVLSGEYIGEKCGMRHLNIAVLGAAAACGVLPFSTADMEMAISGRFAGRIADMNKNALRTGAEMIKN
ncbi:MAG: indolepyruvate oxidoreductase subunit beta [Synergistaceae bacterium]|jgi:indolepyruvate ferredoxin oxidoreductase beta subunit|nr:indolepyruvate oxidoreductase subunit beta [Synergistaceae bacterium]